MGEVGGVYFGPPSKLQSDHAEGQEEHSHGLAGAFDAWLAGPLGCHGWLGD